MRDFDVRFVQDWPSMNVVDLLTVAPEQLPESGGVYMLGTANTPLIYPWGTSPIYYIGQSGNLRERLGSHRDVIAKGRNFGGYYGNNWWPRYQYAIAFGADCCWFEPKKDNTPANLEAELIQEFYDHIGALPAANGSWPSIKQREG